MDLNVAFASPAIKATEAELALLREEVGYEIPAEYLDFLRTVGSGNLEASELRLGLDIDDDVNAREIFSPKRAIEQRRYWTGRVPEQYLVIANSEGGNLICLDLHAEDSRFGSVHFWDHNFEASEEEQPDEENMTRIAGTLAEFLTELYPASEVELPEGTTSWIDPDFLQSLE